MSNADKKLTAKRVEPFVQTGLQLLPLIMDNIPQAVFWKDRNLVYLGCNRAFAEDAGFAAPEDVIGKTDFDMPWKQQAELYRADDRRVVDSGEPKLNYEEPQTTPAGSTIWLRTSKIPICENGRVVAILGMYEDITEHKQAEILHERTERLFRALFEMSPDAVMLIDPYDPSGEWPIVDCNAAACLINGYERDELIGQPINIVNAPTDTPLDRSQYLEQLRQEPNVKYEIFHRRKNGEVFPVEVYTRLIKVGGRELLLGMDRDITERKRAETATRDEQLRSQAILEAIRVPTIISRLSDGLVLYANQAIAEISQVDLNKLVGFPTKSFYANPEDRKTVLGTLQQQGHIEDFEVQFRRTDGSLYWALLSSRVINYQGETCVLSSYLDITRRKQIEEALRESEDRFRRFVEATAEGLIFHEQGRIIDVNPAALVMFGFAKEAEVVGRNLLEFIVPEQHTLVLQKMQLENVPAYELQCIRTDHSRFPVETLTRSYKIGDQVVRATSVRDITERKRTEETLKAHDEFSQKQSAAFADLARSDTLYSGNLEAAFAEVTEAAARTLGVRRASIWYYNEDHTEIGCMDLFEQGQGHSQGIVLTKKDFPAYFKALEAEKVIAADNAHNDPATSEFSASYLTPLGINSMLDAPIRLGGQVIGVICHEHVGPFRRWTVEEQNFARTVGDFVTVTIEAQKRKQAEVDLLLRDRALASTVNAVFIIDLDFKPVYANEAFLKLTGYTYEEAMQLSVADLTGHTEGIGRLDEAMASQGFFIGEEPVRRKDGTIFPSTFSTSYITDAEGKPIAIQASFLDITERIKMEKQIQTALERRGRQVQIATEISQSIAAASSLEELYTRVVDQIKERLGYYHTQLLRDDPTQTAVVLVAGYGEVGANMLAAGYRVLLGEGLIGSVAATGRAILRSAVASDPDWQPHPLLPDTKAEIAVPIKLGDKVLGVLDVQSNVTGALDTDDLLLLESLSGQIATAIESTRLRQEMAERLEEINRLYHAMSHEGWDTYRQAAEAPASFVFDQAGLRPAQDISLTDELFAQVPLAVPGGEVIGTLAVADDLQRPISPEEEDFLKQVSEQLALALESARLFEQTQSALSEVERRASELETVARVSATTSTVLDPDQLLQTVVDLTKERFGLYHAHIYVYEESWNTLLLAAGAGQVGRKLVAEQHAIPMTMVQSLVARAGRDRKPIIVNDVNNEPGFLPNPLLPETCAELAVPMTVGDKLLGVFDVQSNKAVGFSEEDAKVYVTLAAQVGVALQNARLYMEQAALVTQLRELDRLKSSFLANMSHELRTPLNSILGFADVIIEELDGPLTENMSNDLRLIQKNGQHLLHLINDVLDMAKIEAGRMNLNPESFRAYEILEEVTSITSTLASEKNLALFIEEKSDRNVNVYADRTRLRQVMINLVNNAIKFTESGKIAINLESLAGGRILITVKDTGIGIPSDKLEAIFLEFTQVDSSTTRKAGGTGLGLPISRRLVEMHGGRLWAESTGVPGEGSTFFVELPLEARITETVERQAK